jgi:hypothetical protein
MTQSSAEGPQDWWQLLDPPSCIRFQSIKDHELQTMQNHVISVFYLTVALQVWHWGIIEFNARVYTKVFEILHGKLSPVLLNSGSWRLKFPNLSVKNSRESRNHLEPGRNLVVDWNIIVLTKLDLVSPTVGTNCRGFATRFERWGAHGSDEQWDARDTMV